ncbi:MAG: DNA mismatch repair endonuclease MutL [Alphaproteobacteria bacterium]|nr:DNA mismatch repair endonuclease MutL [Alphaproteobacteria bacterium]
MESRIRLLSEATVNRIAAGEVIERPAAAVKELVENALDAGAARITVALAEGGIARIEVSDDGSGMNAAELALAVQRHATSKLADEALVRIATLGFRGEALPSIGAAARLAITSRPPDASNAHTIQVEGGIVSEVAPCAGAPGTRVVVRDLFFATPARRKFLKHPRTEAEHAELAVRRLALAAPGVAFRLESDGRLAFDLPGQAREARVAGLLGEEAAAALLAVDGARDTLRLTGFVCAPALSRATGAAQYLVVNGRPVADPVLKVAVRVAYRDVIAAGRHAVVALFLDMPPDELDVNVHPAKTELRFRDPAAVRSFVISTVSRALSGGAGVASPTVALHPIHSRPAWGAVRRTSPPGFAEAPPAPLRPLPLDAAPGARLLATEAPSHDYPLGAPVAQVLDTYIIAVAADGSLVLVDQHAAHERLTHEALRAQMVDGGVRSQPMLLPAVVELAPADAARLLARTVELARLGLEIEAFGGAAVLVRAMPAALGAPEPRPLLRDLADELAEMDESTALDARLDAVIARLACHGSIRAGRRLGAEEMTALLRQMEATPRAATCSHGRPTYLKLSKAEIETLFGRR